MLIGASLGSTRNKYKEGSSPPQTFTYIPMVHVRALCPMMSPLLTES